MSDKEEITDKDFSQEDQPNSTTNDEGTISSTGDNWEEKYNEINDRYIRLYSEFDNFRKRTIKEKVDIIGQAGADVIKDLLPVLDDFDRAFAMKEPVDLVAFHEGVSLIHTKLNQILVSKGLKSIDATGEVFDTDLHEAITNVPAPTKADKGKVVDMVEKGYFLKDKILRYAKVVVGQ
ncbi:MAG: nucleotide exchange factor GrpE [Crocinitomicaceae bacterium]